MGGVAPWCHIAYGHNLPSTRRGCLSIIERTTCSLVSERNHCHPKELFEKLVVLPKDCFLPSYVCIALSQRASSRVSAKRSEPRTCPPHQDLLPAHLRTRPTPINDIAVASPRFTLRARHCAQIASFDCDRDAKSNEAGCCDREQKV
jgi:hypothetical protein